MAGAFAGSAFYPGGFYTGDAQAGGGVAPEGRSVRKRYLIGGRYELLSADERDAALRNVALRSSLAQSVEPITPEPDQPESVTVAVEGGEIWLETTPEQDGWIRQLNWIAVQRDLAARAAEMRRQDLEVLQRWILARQQDEEDALILLL